MSATDGAARHDVTIQTTAFGGSALVGAALAGTVPSAWYEPTPATAEGWTQAADAVARDFAGRAWLDALAPAFEATGAAAARLARSAGPDGLVVTTGQQPGLFGGPMYTWSKALAALALADALERVTGRPVAPVFWAATDDTDYTEASGTVVAHGAEVRVLRMPERATGAAMADLPLGDVSALFAPFAQAAGSVADDEPLKAVEAAYAADRTVGGAYVTLLRRLFEPLGIAVLDAAHPAVRAAGAPIVRRALQRADDVGRALKERGAAIDAAGFKTQVQHVPNLSLVFHTQDGARKRVPIKQAPALADVADAGAIGPNVLLRPVMERQILPTLSYVAGPGEFAYFAQVSAVADALDAARPRVVPRWSGRLLEPDICGILQRVNATVDDLRDPHAVESRLAREALPADVRDALVGLRSGMMGHTAALRADENLSISLRKAVGGFEAQVEHRIARLERRYAAAVKRQGTVLLHDVAVARASLFPNGVPQERALNVIPFFARYGMAVRDGMLAAARRHADAIVAGEAGVPAGAPPVAASKAGHG